MKKSVIQMELEVEIPETEDEASRSGGILGRVFFNKITRAIEKTLRSGGASAEDASNVLLNSHLISVSYVLGTIISGMDGSPLDSDILEERVKRILPDAMKFAGEVFSRYAKKAEFVIRDKEEEGRHGPDQG